MLCEGALVFLYFEIVLVFREILGHGDQPVADVVPPLEGLVRPGTRGTGGLILRLALTVKTCSRKSKQSDRNERKPNQVQRSLHGNFLLWIDQLSKTHRCSVLSCSLRQNLRFNVRKDRFSRFATPASQSAHAPVR